MHERVLPPGITTALPPTIQKLLLAVAERTGKGPHQLLEEVVLHGLLKAVTESNAAYLAAK